METIVPGLHGSGRNGESSYGLPSLLAASSGGELVIAGTVGACSAGVPTLNAPAKGPTSNVGPMDEEGGQEPMRITGGGGTDRESDDESERSLDLTVVSGKGRVLVEGSVKEVARALQEERDRLARGTNQGGQNRVEPLGSDSGEDPPGDGADSGNEGRSRSPVKAMGEEEGEKEKERETEKEKEASSTRDESLERKKQGRPFTTGEYVGKKEAVKKYNAALNEKLRLEQEERVMRMTGEKLIESLRTSPEEYAARAENDPTADIINRLREAQMEILRTQKASSNLKGTHQGTLKASAGLSLGLIEALRTRVEGNTEVEALRKRQKEQEELLRKAEERANQALSTAEEERRKAEQHLNLLRYVSGQKEETERQLQLARTELQMSSWEPTPALEPMEVVEVEAAEPPVVTADRDKASREEVGRTLLSLGYGADPRVTTGEELESKPWLRPPLLGVAKNMEGGPRTGGKPRIVGVESVDVRLMKNEKGQQLSAPIARRVDQIVRAKEAKMVGRDKERGGATNRSAAVAASEGGKPNKKKKKKGTSPTPNWHQMELVSSQSEREEEEVSRMIEHLMRRGLTVQVGRGDRNEPPPPIKENRRAGPPPPPSAPRTGPPPPSGKRRGGRSEEGIRRRRERRKEKRREKRREEARRRLVASAPPPPSSNKRGGRTTGPVTRSMTGAGAPPRAPSGSSPPAPPQGSTSWAQVVGRKERRGKGQQAAGPGPTTAASIAATAPRGRAAGGAPTGTRGTRGGNQPKPPLKLRKPPRTAAVQITCPEGERAETMRLARARVSLREIGIRDMKPRRARTGALLLEIPGADGPLLADALVDQLRTALADKRGVAITRPQKTAEIRVHDLEDSVSAEEIAAVLADRGGCRPEEVRVGPIRAGAYGLGSVWVRCPLTAANAVVRGGPLTIGWTKARVDMLPERPLRCFRCWGKGHVRAACTSAVDRTGACYRCGENGHTARGCSAPVRCALCAGSRRPANHRAGGPSCRAPAPRNARSGGGPPAPPPSAAAPPGGGTPMEVEEEVEEMLPLPARVSTARFTGEGKRARVEGVPTGGAAILPSPPPASRTEAGTEAESLSRGDSAPTSPAQGVEEAEAGPAGAGEKGGEKERERNRWLVEKKETKGRKSLYVSHFLFFD